MKHKHYDCIVAWAEGKEIEVKVADKWYYAESPAWDIDYEYRIKKEPEIEVKYFSLDSRGDYTQVTQEYIGWNLKITYLNGKAVEVEVAE